jgi:hypothetical protein
MRKGDERVRIDYPLGRVTAGREKIADTVANGITGDIGTDARDDARPDIAYVNME